MSKKNSLTVIIHRDGEVDSTRVRIPLWLVRLSSGLGVTMAVLLVLAATLYAPVARTAARVPGMTRELERLREQNRQVVSLVRTVGEFENRYDQIRNMLGAELLAQRPPGLPLLPRALNLFAAHPQERRYDATRYEPAYWPLRTPGFVTREHVDDASGSAAHPGLDIAVATGTPIRASASGVVDAATRDDEYGLFVRIHHTGGYQTMYGHASRILVAAGDSVASGQVVALTGSTGRSTAPHLHFEILLDGQSLDPRSIVSEN